MVQLSQLYVTTGKTIALTIWTFVGKVMSLLFNTLSRFVIAFLPRSNRLLISWLQSQSTVILEPKKRKSYNIILVVQSPSRVWQYYSVVKKKKKKEWISDTCINADKSWKYWVQVANTKCICYIIPYTWYSKLENTYLVIEIRTIIASGGEPMGQRHERTSEGDTCVLYLNWSYGFMSILLLKFVKLYY